MVEELWVDASQMAPLIELGASPGSTPVVVSLLDDGERMLEQAMAAAATALDVEEDL